IPKHSITAICLPISPAEHPTYIKDEKGRRRSTPLDVNFPSWTSERKQRGASRCATPLDVKRPEYGKPAISLRETSAKDRSVNRMSKTSSAVVASWEHVSLCQRHHAAPELRLAAHINITLAREGELAVAPSPPSARLHLLVT